jgi:outer membrane murein-binding lipoprotein Lpp
MYMNVIRRKHKGWIMIKPTTVTLAAVATFLGLTGCTDLKPLQAQVDQLKTQVSGIQAEVSAARASADAAARAATAAQGSADQAAQAANSARSTANQALAAASSAQSSIDATNEKIDRMFKKSVSK